MYATLLSLLFIFFKKIYISVRFNPIMELALSDLSGGNILNENEFNVSPVSRGPIGKFSTRLSHASTNTALV